MYLAEDIKLKHNISSDELEEAVIAIDALTFNRIRRLGFGYLSSFQQGCVSKALVEHIEFVRNNSEFLASRVKSYSAGGTTVTFNESMFSEAECVTTSSKVLHLLDQTGLRFRGI